MGGPIKTLVGQNDVSPRRRAPGHSFARRTGRRRCTDTQSYNNQGPASCRSDSVFAACGGTGCGAGSSTAEGKGRQRGQSMAGRFYEMWEKPSTPGPGHYHNKHHPSSKTHGDSRVGTAPQIGISSTWQRYGLNTPEQFRAFWVNEANTRHPLGEFNGNPLWRPKSVNSMVADSPSASMGQAPRMLSSSPSRTDLHMVTRPATVGDVIRGDDVGPGQYPIAERIGKDAPGTTWSRGCAARSAVAPIDASGQIPGAWRPYGLSQDGDTSLHGPGGMPFVPPPSGMSHQPLSPNRSAPSHSVAPMAGSRPPHTGDWSRDHEFAKTPLRPSTCPANSDLGALAFPGKGHGFACGGGPGAWQSDVVHAPTATGTRRKKCPRRGLVPASAHAQCSF